MEFKTLFESYRNLVRKSNISIIDEKKLEYSKIFETKIDLFDTLRDFSIKGKMLRGSLFLLSANSYGKKTDESLLNLASSLEFMHSALLIHDDIMDNDELRRGEKTVFAKYKEDAQKKKLKHPEHYGISIGIVVGDIALLMAEELATYCENTYLKKLLQFYTRELRMVGIGQLLDFSYGVHDIEVGPSDIEKMYIYKSARYSFSLPLSLGAIATGCEDEELKIIEELGEKMGLIFQLVDDDLGMFGNEKEIGKPVGSDIRENKKTFMRSMLMQKADDNLRNDLVRNFGKNSLSANEIQAVRNAVVDLGVRQEIKKIIDKLYDESKIKINSLKIDASFRRVYMDLLDYNTKRTF